MSTTTARGTGRTTPRGTASAHSSKQATTTRRTQKPPAKRRKARSKNDVFENLNGMLVETEADVLRLQELAREFRAAPGKVQPNAFSSETAEDMVARTFRELFDQAANVRGRAFWRHPTKRELAARLKNWSTNMYHNIQDGRRTASMNTKPARIRRLNQSMQMYMRHFALRAPHMPPKVRNFVNPGSEFPVLYRGVSVKRTVFNSWARAGQLTEAGYMAFSRDPEYALTFGTRARNAVSVLLRLSVRDVPRGTPWVWFLGSSQDLGTLHHKTWLRSHAPIEEEVLLPPGTLHIRRWKTYTTPVKENMYANNENAEMRKVRVVDVAYRPSNVPWTVVRAVAKLKAAVKRRKGANQRT